MKNNDNNQDLARKQKKWIEEVQQDLSKVNNEKENTRDR